MARFEYIKKQVKQGSEESSLQQNQSHDSGCCHVLHAALIMSAQQVLGKIICSDCFIAYTTI